MTKIHESIRVVGSSLLVAALALWTAGCDTGGLLEVTDPDLVTPESIGGEKGAELLWAGAVGEFGSAFGTGGGGQVVYVGMFTDEFHLSGTFPTRNRVDRRVIELDNGTMNGQYTTLQQARASAENAAAELEEFLPDDPRVAEAYNLAGFTYVLFGENYCEGVPYSGVDENGEIVHGEQTTRAETLQRALDRFASARGATAGDTDQEYLSRIGEARVLVNQGEFAAAADVVAPVPDDWEYLVRAKEGSAFGQRNAVYEFNQSQRRWSLSDAEGGGIPFRSLDDPRVPWEFNDNVGFDESTPLFEQLKYPSWESDLPLASGIEARLIEAEAELADGNIEGMMDILNVDLRSMVEGLDDLPEPANQDEAVEVLFQERALWLFGTAHRLGDARRLIRQYGWEQDEAFPSGSYHKEGGSYGDQVAFPIPEQERENENFPSDGDTCLNREA
ncbi:MAG: hypothetical protein ACOC8B_05145 [Gemmatimonadota bacterium]